MADNESSSSEVQEAPVNCWQYSRDVYLIGRSLKMRRFTDAEREAVIIFITAMAETRPAYVPYINLKADNPPCNEFVDEEVPASSDSETQEGEAETVRKLAWDYLEKQNDYSLAKMVQKIGRSLKVQFCTAEEKGLCDALFEATDAKLKKDEEAEEQSSDASSEEEETAWRRYQRYDVDPATYESAEESSESEEESSASSEEPVVEESSESSEG